MLLLEYCYTTVDVCVTAQFAASPATDPSCHRVLMCGCTVLLLLSGFLLLARVDALTSSPAMGFHEGTRRTAKCEGGYVTGFDIYMGRAMGFAEETVVALRIKCSSGKINVEYLGSTSDSYLFGSLQYPSMQARSVNCPAGSGVAAIEWRRAGSNDKDLTIRIGGLRVHCGMESSPQPFVVDDPGSDKVYPVSLRCSEANTPLKQTGVRLTAVEVWFEQSFAGLHFLECEPGKQ